MNLKRGGTRQRRIVVNVLNIVDDQLAGAAIFSKNILKVWLQEETSLEVVILHSSSIDVFKVLELPVKSNVIARKVSARGFLARIVYEQLVLPFFVRSFDIYFSPTPVMPLLARWFAPRTRIILTIHDMIPFFVKKKYGFMRGEYVKLISKWGAILADSVVVVSQNTRTDVVSLTKVSPNKVTVIYNFLTSAFHPDNHLDNKFLLSISTVEPGKNLENTLTGYARFLDKYKLPQYRFYWIGKVGWGYTIGELETRIAALGLQDQFRLLGFVAEEEKQQMLRDCTAMVYLSHYEGFGIPVLEGLYHNKPALVSASSSLPEVVGEAGILCDSNDTEAIADGMFELVSNLEKYRMHIATQVEKFDKITQLRNFMKLIHG